MKIKLILLICLHISCASSIKNHVKDYNVLRIKNDIKITGIWIGSSLHYATKFTIRENSLNNEIYDVSDLYIDDIIRLKQPYCGTGFYSDSLLKIKYNRIIPRVVDGKIVGLDTMQTEIQFISLEAEGEECLLPDFIYKNIYTNTEYEVRDSLDLEIKEWYADMKKYMIKSGVPIIFKRHGVN